MTWKDCDEGFGAEDWLKWENSPFTLTFLGQPKFERKEFKGKPNEQAIFTVVHEGEEKQIGLSKLAFRTFRKLAEKVGSAALATTPIYCQRTGSSFDTAYEFHVASEVGQAEDGDPGPGDDSDLPF